VHSAYRLCVNELVDLSHIYKPRYWAGIWKLKTPPKVKNMIWRLCRSCLPSRVRLLDKDVQCPTQCISCDSNHEDLAHVFFEFPFAVQVCSMAGLWQEIQVVVASSPSAIEVVFALLHSLSATLSQRLAAIF
jgi:hypothetical protein